MNGSQASYPDFVPNQILTNTQLNDLRKYLDLQDRATRSKLIGMGIVCGLTWVIEGPVNARKLVLDGGLGLTSDGWQVCVPGATFNRARPYRDPAVEENGQTPQYEPWRTSPTGGQRDIIELLAVATGEPPPQGSHALNQGDLDDRVVVLYVELGPVELRSCFVTECDNKGQKVNVIVRVLLVQKIHLSNVPPCEHPLARVAVPRLHGVAPLSGITKSADIDVGYRTIVNGVAPELVRRIRLAFNKFGAFLGLDEATHMTPVESVFKPAVMAGAAVNQYHYDAVKEMAAAYNEFVAEACKLVIECCPQRDFPRHLMLGMIDFPRDYRHPFYPSAVRNVVDAHVERVRKLFERIGVMAGLIDFKAADALRLTPSTTEQEPLGARAIPHYYPLAGDAAKLWQPAMCCTAETPWSYAGSTANADLEHDDYNRAALIRVEGHLGNTCELAGPSIVGLRHDHNAEFDLLLTNFEDVASALAAVSAGIGEALKNRADALERYRELIIKAVADDTFDEPDLNAAVKKVDTHDAALRELIDKWAETRCARRLHCDIAHLQMTYGDTRSELLCLLSGVLAALGGITDAAIALGDKLPKKRLQQLAMIVGVLRGQVRWLLDLALPPRLCGFHYPLFVARYKDLLQDLTTFWLWWRSLGFPVHDEKLDEVVDRPWPAGGESISAILLAAVRGCFQTRFARIWLGYEHVWDNDPSFFPKLVELVDGLEHLAGVRRCGTLVLVCDRTSPAADLKVTADFSLSCRLPCCCDVDIDGDCLPIVALPHHRVVRLDELDNGAFRPVEMRIVLEPPGYEPNFRRGAGGAGKPPLSVSLPAPNTHMGGTVALGADGGIVYKHSAPLPGLIDVFDYVMESEHECGGKDRAQVSILMEPEPRVAELAVPKGGHVSGTVTYKGKLLDAIGAMVYVAEARIAIPIGVDSTGKPGFYRSGLLPAGDYHLIARLDELFSDEVVVHVSNGQETVQDLDLAPRSGNVHVFVVDHDDRPIKVSTVALLAGQAVHAQSDQPDAGGLHAFPDVPPGTYKVAAAAPRFAGASVDDVTVKSRDTVSRRVVLEPLTIRIPDRYAFRVAIELNEDIDEFRKRAGRIYEARYQENEKRIISVGDNPDVASSDPYKRAVEFFEKAITNEEVPVEVLAKAYQKVADGLLRSIVQPTSDAEKKKAMRAVLIDVTGAYLDRVTLDQPDDISAEVTRSVEVASATLRRSEITANVFKTSWKSEELFNELRSTNAVKLADMIQ